jgi:triphosphoribosyl-dephospho-CoA synthase
MTLTPESVRLAAQTACVLEASAEKPGNVTPARRFRDMSHLDFMLSALAIGPAMARAGQATVGETILAAVRATHRCVAANTNLGIVLLFAPLARAALLPEVLTLRERLSIVLHALSIDDANLAFEAIRLAHPGGLDSAPEGDVNDGPPTMTLRTAMQLAAGRDSIASEYITDYAIVFNVALPALRAAQAQGGAARPQGVAALDQIVRAHLAVLAAVPDTLIARKRGLAVARAVSTRAAEVLALGADQSDAGRNALAAFDAYLRSDGNRLNPGTTADLIAATLFVQELEHP